MSIANAAAVLAAHTELNLAIVYGSVARGRARPQSDIDVAIAATVPLTAAQKLGLIEELAFATGRPVDLVDLADVGEPLLGEIVRDGILVVGSTEDLSELRLRHVYLNEDFMPYVKRMLETRNNAWLR